jgi:hypothetical protein
LQSFTLGPESYDLYSDITNPALASDVAHFVYLEK